MTERRTFCVTRWMRGQTVVTRNGGGERGCVADEEWRTFVQRPGLTFSTTTVPRRLGLTSGGGAVWMLA